MPAKLTLFPPQRAARFLVVHDGESLAVGRDPGCELVIEDARVSKRHAEMRWSGSGWTLEDLGSKNGTTINGQAAAGAALRDGDTVSFGGLSGRFEKLSAAEAATSRPSGWPGWRRRPGFGASCRPSPSRPTSCCDSWKRPWS